MYMNDNHNLDYKGYETPPNDEQTNFHLKPAKKKDSLRASEIAAIRTDTEGVEEDMKKFIKAEKSTTRRNYTATDPYLMTDTEALDGALDVSNL